MVTILMKCLYMPWKVTFTKIAIVAWKHPYDVKESLCLIFVNSTSWLKWMSSRVMLQDDILHDVYTIFWLLITLYSPCEMSFGNIQSCLPNRILLAIYTGLILPYISTSTLAVLSIILRSNILSSHFITQCFQIKLIYRTTIIKRFNKAWKTQK